MSCLKPIIIKNPRYRDLRPDEVTSISQDLGVYVHRPFAKDGYHNVPMDWYLKVPCGRCEECLRVYRKQWITRLTSELMYTAPSSRPVNNYFVTLTFDEPNLERFSKEGFGKSLSLFIDRFRKFYGCRPRYFIISELGSCTGRYHFHAIFFDCPKLSTSELEKIWSYGFVYLGTVSQKTVLYVTKYLLKTFQPREKGSDFVLRVSRGLGFRKDLADHIHTQYVNFINGSPQYPALEIFGRFYPIPRYFKKKSLSPRECYEYFVRCLDSPPAFYIGKHEFDNEFDFHKAANVRYAESVRLGLSLPPRSVHRKPSILKDAMPDIEFVIYCSELVSYYDFDSIETPLSLGEPPF